MTTTLLITEAVPLLAAWTDRFARAHGHRSLVIKGEVLEHQGLRGRHTSIDVDLLVDPATFDDFIADLDQSGWREKLRSTVPGADQRHAVTVYHAQWPITIDVHRYFPGFLTDPQVVFDNLWERRITATVAHVELTTLDPVGHAALAGLHYVRSPRSGLAMKHIPDLVTRIPHALGDHGLAELTALTETVGAAESLRPILDAVGAPVPTTPSADIDALRRWELRQTAAPSTNWVMGIFARPFHQWPAAIWHAIWLTDEEIDHIYRRTSESRLVARARRLGKGLRNLPGALRSVAAYEFKKVTNR